MKPARCEFAGDSLRSYYFLLAPHIDFSENDMKKAEPYRADPDLEELLPLVISGRLFAVQAWIQSGRTIPNSNDKRKRCALSRAVEAGFHSMVDILLQSKVWTQKQRDEALSLAISDSRLDLAELLQAHGAASSSVDFELVCRTVKPEVMERFLRAGGDPSKENGFARALSEMQARPLLRFYRSLKDEFPSLHLQASLALGHAVREKKIRWIALLAWAGADPFMNVPDDLYSSWEFGEYGGRIPAHDACWSRNSEVVKALQLKPTHAQALELLEHAAYFPSVDVMKEILRKLPTGGLNIGDPPKSLAVERLVESLSISDYGYGAEDRGKEAAGCLELLLDLGARWRPEKTQIDSIRRSLLKQPPRFIVRIIRLLLHIPGAADHQLLFELCRTSVIRSKIAESDKHLLKDLDAIQKKAPVQRP